MKAVVNKLILISLLFTLSISCSQTVIEIPKPETSASIDSIFTELKSKRDSGFYSAIEVLEKGLNHASTDFELYKVSSNLGALYTFTNQVEKSLDLWSDMSHRGICYNYAFIDTPFPPYLEAYKNNKRFQDFMQKNDSIRNVISQDSKAEYFVNLPLNYDKKLKYPLLIILHGGIGNSHNTFENWQSETINKDFVTVYPQGRDMKGSFARSYGSRGIEDISDIYSQVVKKYSIDTTAVILAGQSAGGALSLRLANDHIKVKGLMLAFPVKPNEFDFLSAKGLSNSNVSVFMICGEQDKRFYPGQLELAVFLDSAKVNNLVVKYPSLGHDFPDDFGSQLDKGINFIRKL